MFLSHVLVEDDPEPGYWIHRAPLIWDDAIFGHIVVPVGFRTDFASYPGVLRGLPCFNVNGKSRRPAAVHDWMYAAERTNGRVSKLRADMFLKAALLAEGVNEICAQATYSGVHWCGGPSWAGDEGALHSRDFDTVANYKAWLASVPVADSSGVVAVSVMGPVRVETLPTSPVD